jgi:hypothetical protein
VLTPERIDRSTSQSALFCLLCGWQIAITVLSAALAHGKENPAATANYEKALQQLKSGDLKVDFKALRLNCAASKYECQDDPDDIKALFSLVNDKQFDQVLKKSQSYFGKGFRGCRVALYRFRC